MAVHLMAILHVKNESKEEIKEILFNLILSSREENGCIQYIINQDSNNDSIFIVDEIWENEICLAQHKTSQTGLAGQIIDKLISLPLEYFLNNLLSLHN